MTLMTMSRAATPSVTAIRLMTQAAFQQELIALLVLMPLAVCLPVAALERLALVVSMLLVLIAELLNSAIEATVDRISRERHPLAAQAKDMGSAAVLLALLLCGASWAAAAWHRFAT